MLDRLAPAAVLVHLNIDKPETKPISKRYHVGGIPTVVILSPEGAEVDRIIGYDDDRSAWLKTLLASMYGIDTIQDLEARFAKKADLLLAHDVAQKYLDRGDGADALVWVKKARELGPDAGTEAKLTLIQGQALLFTDPAAGADTLMKLATTPGSPLAVDAFQSLSVFYMRQARNATSVEEKQKAKAARLDVYHKVMAAQPDNPDVLADYAWYCAGEEIELDKALAAATKAVELKPKDTDALATLAEVTFKSGKPAEALEILNRALALDPDSDFLKREKEKFSKPASGKT